MKQKTHTPRHRWLAASAAVMLGVYAIPATAQDSSIIHDAEYYMLAAQHGEKWMTEDVEIDAKLAELREKHGKPPNIIHVMWDDTPVGEIGIPELQKVRGFETPVLNSLADQGMNMMRMYTEPSCTPSRAAVMTGRHAVRNGMYNVGFPYEYGGLAEDEVTMAEVLSEVGYATAFFGKSHLGDVESSYLNNQGFDEAIWTPYNQVPSLYVPNAQLGALTSAVMFPDMFGDDPYDIDPSWRPMGYVWALEGKKDGPVREFGTPPVDHDGYMALEDAFETATIDFVQRHAEGDQPFYVAWWPQLTSFQGFPDRVTASGGFLQEALVRMDARIGRLTAELERLGIAENTLVVLMADNGPMVHNGPPGMTETLYTGGKGDYTEGGVPGACHCLVARCDRARSSRRRHHPPDRSVHDICPARRCDPAYSDGPDHRRRGPDFPVSQRRYAQPPGLCLHLHRQCPRRIGERPVQAASRRWQAWSFWPGVF